MSERTGPWAATVLTLFPEMFPGPLGHSLAGQGARRRASGRWTALNLRDFASDRHHTVDDTPFGGGAGMVMRPDVVARALDRSLAAGAAAAAALPSAARRAARPGAGAGACRGPGRGLLCGRFEGVDQRVIEARGAGGGLARRFRAVGRRDRRHGPARCLRAAAARRGRRCRPRSTRRASRTACWSTRTTPGPQVWEGRAGARRAAVGPSRPDRRLAPRSRRRASTRTRRPDLWARHLADRAAAAPASRPIGTMTKDAMNMIEQLEQEQIAARRRRARRSPSFARATRCGSTSR